MLWKCWRDFLAVDMKARVQTRCIGGMQGCSEVELDLGELTITSDFEDDPQPDLGIDRAWFCSARAGNRYFFGVAVASASELFIAAGTHKAGCRSPLCIT